MTPLDPAGASAPGPALVKRFARLFVAVQMLTLAFFIAGTHGAFAPVGPITTDFVSFYAAGDLARDGDGPGAYDQIRHHAAEERATAPGIAYQYFFYPPTYLLLMAPLSRLPYLASFLLFEASTLAFWLVVTTRIAGRGTVGAWALLAIPSVWWTIGLGQNSFLSAGLMALGTLLLRSQPWIAGIAFGLICFKPHFGLLIPLALLAGREFRAATAAAITVAACVASSAALYGVPTWVAFFNALQHSGEAFDTGRILFAGHIDTGGAARLTGVNLPLARALQVAATLSTAILIIVVWRPAARVPRPLRYAVLAAGALAAAPVALFYDLVMAGVAAAWLVRAAHEENTSADAIRLLILLLLTLLAAHPIVTATHIPFGALVAPGLLYLAIHRALQRK